MKRKNWECWDCVMRKNWECWDFVCLNKINLIPDLQKQLWSSFLFAWLQTTELPATHIILTTPHQSHMIAFPYLNSLQSILGKHCGGQNYVRNSFPDTLKSTMKITFIWCKIHGIFITGVLKGNGPQASNYFLNLSNPGKKKKKKAPLQLA